MLFLWIKALHVIAVVAWFAGLFYLPRLFVYHAEAKDEISLERFKVMEYRLYYAITYPAGVLATFFGLCLILFNATFYMHAPWMIIKFGCVFLLWIYHLQCGKFLKVFKNEKNERSSKFYRMFNEIPTVFLIVIVICVIVKPF